MSPKLNYSKVQSLTVTPMRTGIGVQVLYKSQQRRDYTYGPDELGLGDLIVAARKAGVTISGLCQKCESTFPTTSYLYVDTPLAVCDACYAAMKAQEPQPPDGAIWCQLCGEHPALPGAPCDVCAKMGATSEHIEPEPASDEVAQRGQPNTLAAMLGLTHDQAESFKGTDRLNFWRNGCLNVQVQHGCRATKIKLPNAVVTDAQLDDFFAAWGWQKLGQKPYFKPTAASLVRI
jgi:hypothetical protein